MVVILAPIHVNHKKFYYQINRTKRTKGQPKYGWQILFVDCSKHMQCISLEFLIMDLSTKKKQTLKRSTKKFFTSFQKKKENVICSKQMKPWAAK